MSKAVGILELSSIAKGMETGDAMLKSANVELLVSKTLCPGKFLLMLGGDVGRGATGHQQRSVPCW
ncbi:propanediol utilization protein PduT [Escherichia coli]|uniref:Propanediol utilization protein PduT n=1 Tax=Escherichia coli TaxID=562 RepID=A0A376KRR6_ECOLX|nr:propanediol utilization protein PduT [Escherichia coli]